jgi:hypothetical protein
MKLIPSFARKFHAKPFGSLVCQKYVILSTVVTRDVPEKSLFYISSNFVVSHILNYGAVHPYCKV